ncbi:unnamed protein product [Ixodes hexagonus]
MLALLGPSRQWFADGTFKVAPALFYQLYTVHCKVNGAVIPAVYVLMKSKTEAAYTKLLSVLKSKCAAADPSTVLLDFEQAANNAFRRVFPSCQALGCFFHLRQCVYRKLQSEGLQESYWVDGAFNLMARMIPAIALVPEGDVFDAFEALSRIIGVSSGVATGPGLLRGQFPGTTDIPGPKGSKVSSLSLEPPCNRAPW